MVSWQSALTIGKYRLTRRKRTFADPVLLRRSAESHESEHAQLPPSFRDRFEVTEHDVRGHCCYTLRPPRTRNPQHVLYLHGGAYVHQIEAAHWDFLDRLIARTGAAVSVPLYPLAPTYDHTATLPMVWSSFQRTAARAAPADQVVMGDSAGGALSLFLAQRQAAFGRPQPGRLVLISPWLDIAVSHPDVPALDRQDPYLGIAGLREAGRLYAGDLDPHDPRVSPLYGQLGGLGPMRVLSGTRDVLLSDARRLNALARARGAAVDYEEYEGMFHGWILQRLPEARTALDRTADFLRTGAVAGASG
ncbi:alpha/beta hydrolase [Saccharopolyspora gloriosae]|uniref:Acetyl esterase/lipase n=1 Tax=Saccharopolyspora gloriosae TaxID=455344 RepID=A0A840NGR3_9PSEU|nr:alpha/beta hydrolase [Saccharopolyspora gloriosae]MBB5070211.1 acetyl esterase/lipase [Saccharopolyspora gloriosae]